MSRLALFLAASMVFLYQTTFVQAQESGDPKIEVSDQPDSLPEGVAPSGSSSGATGKKAAQKYMGQKPKSDSQATDDDSESTFRAPGGTSKEPHYLAVHIGGFVGDNEYQWGQKSSDTNVGRLNLGVTYRIGEWQNSMDLDGRVEYQTFNLQDGTASKISLTPLILFPDASSKFPLYFGFGAGLGLYTHQFSGFSPISIDYELVVGLRFFNLRKTPIGVFVEGGLKNNFLLFSPGQFNGEYLAVGGIFTF